MLSPVSDLKVDDRLNCVKAVTKPANFNSGVETRRAAEIAGRLH
jgi:hypothetical protein